jgi:hypothetical protein
MNEKHAAELYRQEGTNSRFVNLTVKPDGSVLMETQDMGEYVERIWGDSDYEFWMDVPAGALPKLVFALLRDRYAGRAGAVDEFRISASRKQSTTNGTAGHRAFARTSARSSALRPGPSKAGEAGRRSKFGEAVQL